MPTRLTRLVLAGPTRGRNPKENAQQNHARERGARDVVWRINSVGERVSTTFFLCGLAIRFKMILVQYKLSSYRGIIINISVNMFSIHSCHLRRVTPKMEVYGMNFFFRRQKN